MYKKHTIEEVNKLFKERGCTLISNKYEGNRYKLEYIAQCGQHGGKLNAHHINGYNTDKENRLNIDNGITLCEQCHIDFHRKYGYGLNTKEQFNKWIDGNTEIRA